MNKPTTPANLPRHTRRSLSLRAAALAFIALAFSLATARAETCTTQSGLVPADRDAIANAARNLSSLIQANDTTALRAAVVAEIAKDFTSLQSLTAATSPRLVGAFPIVDQVYLLDASALKPNADGSPADAQFFCSLNRTTAEAEFIIPALPQGNYAFAMVNFAAPSATATPAPWRLSFLLRQEQGKWLLAGLYPRPLTAAGHDGLWYWTQARELVKQQQPWNAWLYYSAAQKLLQPADFVLSSHLDKLRTEQASAAPPVLSLGVSASDPLTIQGADGVQYRFVALDIDDSLAQPTLDIAAHIRVDPTPDPAIARKRNDAAAAALIDAYPQLRSLFHGVWIFAESPGLNPFATEQPISAIK